MVCFDFDGTIISRNSLLLLFANAVGWKHTFFNILQEIPSILFATLGLKDKDKAKEKLFGRFFRGWSEEQFVRLAEATADKNKHLMRPKIVQKLQECVSLGDKVLVVCDAGDLWVKAFLKDIPEVEIVATKIEVYNGQLTGRFASPVCKRMEKVRRLVELYPERKTYRLTVYGDSRDDVELLDFADEGHLV